MKLDLNNANGKAGEHYFAYWILKNFNWPCRLLDVDIGIDAQLEVMDEDNHSVGEFIAVQIKTSIDSDLKVSIKLKHIQYWNSMKEPVILILVSFVDSEPKIYWQLINKNTISPSSKKSTKRKANEKEQKTISIQFTKKDLLSKNKMNHIKELQYKDQLEHIASLHDKMEHLWTETVAECYNENLNEYNHAYHECFDATTAHHFLEYFNSACNIIDTIEELTSQSPTLTSLSRDIDTIEYLYGSMLSLIDAIVIEINNTDYISNYEFKTTWSTSDSHRTIVKMFE